MAYPLRINVLLAPSGTVNLIALPNEKAHATIGDMKPTVVLTAFVLIVYLLLTTLGEVITGGSIENSTGSTCHWA